MSAGEGISAEQVDRRPVIFELPQSTASELSQNGEEFYEHNSEDVSKMYTDLVSQKNTSELLITKRFIKEKDQALKIAAYKHSIMRFHLFNRFVVQAQFLSSESVSQLFNFLSSICQKKLDFHLILARKKIEYSDATLLDAEIAPKSKFIVHFKDEENYATNREGIESFLKMDATHFCSPSEADRLSDQWLSVNTVYHPYLSIVSSGGTNSHPQNGQAPSSNSEYKRALPMPGTSANSNSNNRPAGPSTQSKMPKWFKPK